MCSEQKDDVPQFVVLDYPDGITDPISLDLLQGFKPGFAITVVAKTCDVFKFEIKDCSGNILLHVVTRFAKNCMILNSNFCGWGPEERTPNMPIRKNEKFSLVCTYEEDGYRVFIDGVQIAFYKHRSTNPPKVCEIGGAQIFKVIYGKGQPLWAIKNTTLDFGPHGIPSYTTTLPQLVPGSWISMSGLVNEDCVCIRIDLVNEHKDIMFHFNPRFNKGYVVRNSFLNGRWGAEETGGGMPLTKCKPFSITYVLETSCIRIYVNGMEFTTYNHRAIYAPETTIRITGGIKLLKYSFVQ
ncbi:galectin [Carabus blaptoides fortunei]